MTEERRDLLHYPSKRKAVLRRHAVSSSTTSDQLKEIAEERRGETKQEPIETPQQTAEKLSKSRRLRTIILGYKDPYPALESDSQPLLRQIIRGLRKKNRIGETKKPKKS